MPYDLSGKVAFITGGASGLGLFYAKELLRNGLKGVGLADLNETFGAKALEDINGEFGKNKAIFVKTDVTDKNQFQNAFRKTIETFKNLDIIINNAGIMNDAIWEREISININASVYGTLLGLEELPKHRSSSEAVVVNIASIAGLGVFPGLPVYVATKWAVIGMSRSFGAPDHYTRTGVRVLTLCPGVTNTPLITEMTAKNLGPAYEKINQEAMPDMKWQEPEHVAKAMAKIIKEAHSGSVWVVEGGEDPYKLEFPEMRKK